MHKVIMIYDAAQVAFIPLLIYYELIWWMCQGFLIAHSEPTHQPCFPMTPGIYREWFQVAPASNKFLDL